MTEDEALANIKEVFDGTPPDALDRRVRVLYNLAKNCKKGEIVELGTYLGYGSFALAYGAMSCSPVTHPQIYTVDDYREKKGWSGELYAATDYPRFRDKRRALHLSSKVVLITMDAVDAAGNFENGEIGLLYIDTGLNVREIFDAWKDKVAPDGIVAFRDTLTRNLKCDAIAADAISSGKFFYIDSPDNYFILIRRVDA